MVVILYCLNQKPIVYYSTNRWANNSTKAQQIIFFKCKITDFWSQRRRKRTKYFSFIYFEVLLYNKALKHICTIIIIYNCFRNFNLSYRNPPILVPTTKSKNTNIYAYVCIFFIAEILNICIRLCYVLDKGFDSTPVFQRIPSYMWSLLFALFFYQLKVFSFISYLHAFFSLIRTRENVTFVFKLIMDYLKIPLKYTKIDKNWQNFVCRKLVVYLGGIFVFFYVNSCHF